MGLRKAGQWAEGEGGNSNGALGVLAPVLSFPKFQVLCFWSLRTVSPPRSAL